MKKPYILIAVVMLVVGGLTFGALSLSKSSPKKAAATTPQTPGVPINLIACGNSQSGVECIAIYKSQCAVFAFDASTGKITGAQPVQPKYCGLR